jgi:hypothetical protein
MIFCWMRVSGWGCVSCGGADQGSFVIVSMTDDRCRLDTVVCKLTLHQARRTALELLSIVESAEAANARSER